MVQVKSGRATFLQACPLISGSKLITFKGLIHSCLQDPHYFLSPNRSPHFVFKRFTKDLPFSSPKISHFHPILPVYNIFDLSFAFFLWWWFLYLFFWCLSKPKCAKIMHIIWPIFVQIQITVLHHRINSVSYIITSLLTVLLRPQNGLFWAQSVWNCFSQKTQFAFKYSSSNAKSTLNGA